MDSIINFVVFISKVNPTVFPINLFPKGDWGETAIMVVSSIVILGKAALTKSNMHKFGK
jgi:hypothetical protein